MNLVVDSATGEIVGQADVCEECQRKADHIAGLERDVRGWAVRYAELKRERDVIAREHDLWPVAQDIFREWRSRCRHPRSAWTTDRFWLIEPFLAHARYGKTVDDRIALCLRAVKGAQYDAFEVKRRNGSVKRFDEWERIFESAGKFEEFCNRAPLGGQA